MLNLKDFTDEELKLLAESIQNERDARSRSKYEELFNNFKEALLALHTDFPIHYAGSYGGEDYDWDDIYKIIF